MARAILWRRAATFSAVFGVALVWVVVGDDLSWVWADTEGPDESAEETTARLRAVVNRIYLVIMAIATALGTLFLTIAGVRWMVAGGEIGAIDGAKRSMTGVALGYGIAVLATILMGILDWILAAGGEGS